VIESVKSNQLNINPPPSVASLVKSSGVIIS